MVAIVFFGLSCSIAGVEGCLRKTAPPAWALTAPERTVGDVIAAANAAVVKYEADVANGIPATANPQLKAVMKSLWRNT